MYQGEQVRKWCCSMYRRIGPRKTCSVLLGHKAGLESGGKEEGEWAGTLTPYEEVESLA